MPGCDADALVISGVGVTSAIAQGRPAFTDALLAGAHRFGVMQRAGRQVPDGAGGVSSAFIGAEIDDFVMPGAIPLDKQRNASWSAQVALATLHEAWTDAGLEDTDPERIGLIVGGSNVQQREIVQTHAMYRDRVEFLRPTYAMTFLDSDLCGLCSEVFGIRGLAFTVGGASASGQLAVIQAIEAVRCGQVDVCIALGAMMDLSYYECQAFQSVGAMAGDRFIDQPELACRPFDRDHDGFVFGEACGAVVIERAGGALRVGRKPYCVVRGWGLAWDANRNPNPSLEGEMTVIRRALAKAGLGADGIDYVNPHGTASIIGDDTELEALRRSGLSHARINTTKSVVGHGLTAAGIVELIAVVVQMEAGKLHPSRNLDHPIDPDFGWVRAHSIDHRIEHALNMSMGFGGINSALCVGRC